MVNARRTSDGAVLVSPDNFVRAESDLYFGNVVGGGGFGKFMHIRELTPLDNQLVVRSNRDTLYSAGETRIRSTTSRRSATPTARSPFSSVIATTLRQTAYRSRRAGTTWCGCTNHTAQS